MPQFFAELTRRAAACAPPLTGATDAAIGRALDGALPIVIDGLFDASALEREHE